MIDAKFGYIADEVLVNHVLDDSFGGGSLVAKEADHIHLFVVVPKGRGADTGDCAVQKNYPQGVIRKGALKCVLGNLLRMPMPAEDRVAIILHKGDYLCHVVGTCLSYCIRCEGPQHGML
ncbi:MAG: hypothetical protein DDT37_01202 [Firmicutes bacterium]|nr:hypothetical protein [candidate division NPL-UPA2 bacterium]